MTRRNQPWRSLIAIEMCVDQMPAAETTEVAGDNPCQRSLQANSGIKYIIVDCEQRQTNICTLICVKRRWMA